MIELADDLDIEAMTEIFIANFVLTQTKMNIGAGPPEVYFVELAEQCSGGRKRHRGITDETEIRTNPRMSCVSETLLDGAAPPPDGFPEARRQLMVESTRMLSFIVNPTCPMYHLLVPYLQGGIIGEANDEG